jgi:predicted ATPase
VTDLEEQAIARARQLNHQNTIGYALFYSGALSSVRKRDFRGLGRLAKDLLDHGRQHRQPQWIAFGTTLSGIAVVHAGAIGEGISKIEEGLALCEKIETTFMHTVFLSGLGEAQLMAGHLVDAGSSLDRAFSAASGTQVRWANAEMWRLRGALALARHDPSGVDEAAECFQRGIETAQAQGSKTLALRLTTSLARLWGEQGKIAQAQQMVVKALEPICGGEDTPDPKEARELWRQLT